VLNEKHNFDWNPQHHRLRCNGHIINLAAQAFLFPAFDPEAIEKENNLDLLKVPTKQDVIDWRMKGPLGKLHNPVVYIQRSAQRIALFTSISGGLRLIRDNSTRWNSWYQMIERGIELHESVTWFCQRQKRDTAADFCE
jgi:hypothetical protein